MCGVRLHESLFDSSFAVDGFDLFRDRESRINNGLFQCADHAGRFCFEVAVGLHLAAHQYNSTYVFPNGTTISVDYGDPRMASGAHLFSEDGVDWRTSEYALYNNTVVFANNTKVDMNYRERPEVITDDSGTPIYLVSGVEW